MADNNHGDDFSRYGTGATGQGNMLRDPTYVAIGTTTSPATTNPPDGRTHHMRSTPVTGGTAEALRPVMGGDKVTARVAGRFYTAALPDDNTSMYFFQLRDNANDPQVTLRLNSTGVMEVMSGGISGVSIGITAVPKFGANAYHYVEMVAHIAQGSPLGGWVDVYLDGNDTPIITVDGVDTQATAVPSVAQYVVARSQTPGGKTWDYADLSHGDTSTVIGLQSWRWLTATGDTLVTDFVRNTGSFDYDCIDDAVPDDDTTYIEATAALQTSQFDMANVPASASEVLGCFAVSLTRKTDTGAAKFLNGIVNPTPSPDVGTDGSTHTLTDVYVYYKDAIPNDPATGVPWTPTAINAARLKLQKVAA